jgi:hypothetical protein
MKHVKIYEDFHEPAANEAKNPKPMKEEKYIVFKGEEIAGTASSLDKAWEIYNGLPPKTRILDGRAIYRAIYEE